MITEIRAKTLADISATQVTLTVGRMKDAGTSLRTCNSYLTSMKVFVNWCRLDGRLHEDVLLAVTAYDHATDPRHPRRAPSVDEIHCLLDTARSRSAEQCDFFGEDRAMAYETSFLTGFRANEIRSLTPENYDIEGDHPCITMRARNSKRRRLDIQPLPEVAVLRFATWLTGKPAGRRIFEKMPRDTARMLRADLAIARAAWIAEAAAPAEKKQREESDFLKYENSVGEFFDFHACRHGYITLISETCKSVKQAQTLARVSTPKLLDRYSHIQLHGMQQAADAVGQMLANGGTRQPGRRREAAAAPLAATGTDDEKPALANRSIRGASRGTSRASGGRTRHAVAGLANCDAPDAEPSDQPASDPETKKPSRWPLLTAHREGFTNRGSGRSRTDDGGFAIRNRAPQNPRKTRHPRAMYTPMYTASPPTVPSLRWSRHGRACLLRSGQASSRWCRRAAEPRRGTRNRPAFRPNKPRLFPLCANGRNWKSGAGSGPGWGQSKGCRQTPDPMPALLAFLSGFPKTVQRVLFALAARLPSAANSTATSTLPSHGSFSSRFLPPAPRPAREKDFVNGGGSFCGHPREPHSRPRHE